MPNIFASIKAEAEKLDAEGEKFDVRKALPDIIAALGVNQSDEHEIFHALLTFIVKALQAGVSAEVQNVGL
jgi:hypothetical protein